MSVSEEKNIFITGVSGFIGRYIARYLTRQGWSVFGCDTISIENAPTEYLVKYFEIELPNSTFDELLKQIKPYACIHCAGRASVPQSYEYLRDDFENAPILVFDLLESLKNSSPESRFLFMSSAAVYGDPSRLPISENHTSSPISPYGFHKRQAELICEEFAKVFGIKTLSARIFSAYGPGLRRQVVWDICRRIMDHESVYLQGTGEETRDFVHVTDIAIAVQLLIKSATFEGETYNVASGQETSIQSISKIICDALDVSIPIKFSGVLPDGVPRKWRADIGKIKTLGFDCSVAIESGISDFATWVRSQFS